MTRRARHLARMRRRSPKWPRWFRGQIDFIRTSIHSAVPVLRVGRREGMSAMAPFSILGTLLGIDMARGSERTVIP